MQDEDFIMHAAMNQPIAPSKQEILSTDEELIRSFNFWAVKEEDKAAFRAQWSKPEILRQGQVAQNTDWRASGDLGDMLGTIANDWEQMHPSNAWTDDPNIVVEKQRYWSTALEAFTESEKEYTKHALRNLTNAWKELEAEYTSRPATPTKRSRSGSTVRTLPVGKRARGGDLTVEDAVMNNGIESIGLHTALGGAKSNALTDKVMNHLRSAWKAKTVQKQAQEVLEIAQRSGLTCKGIETIIGNVKNTRVNARVAAFQSAQAKSEVSSVVEPALQQVAQKVQEERIELRASDANALVVFQQEAQEIDSEMTSVIAQLPNQLLQIVEGNGSMDTQMMAVIVPNALPESVNELFEEAAEAHHLQVAIHEVDNELEVVQREMVQLSAPPVPLITSGSVTPDQVKAQDMIREQQMNQIVQQKAFKEAKKIELEKKNEIVKTQFGKIVKKGTVKKAVKEIKEQAREEMLAIENTTNTLQQNAMVLKTQLEQEMDSHCENVARQLATLQNRKEKVQERALITFGQKQKERMEFDGVIQKEETKLIAQILPGQKKNQLDDQDILLNDTMHQMDVAVQIAQEQLPIEIEKALDVMSRTIEITEGKNRQLEKALNTTGQLMEADRQQSKKMWQDNQLQIQNTLVQKDLIAQVVRERDHERHVVEVIKAQKATLEANWALEKEKLERERDQLKANNDKVAQEAVASVQVHISEQLRVEFKQKQDKIEELQGNLLERVANEKALTERIGQMEQSIRPPVILPGAKPENLEHNAEFQALQAELRHTNEIHHTLKKDYATLRSHLAQMTNITNPETPDDVLSLAIYNQKVQVFVDAVLAKVKDSKELQSRFQVPTESVVEIKNHLETATMLQERTEKAEVKQVIMTAQKTAQAQLEINHLHHLSTIQNQAMANMDTVKEKINNVTAAVQQQVAATSTNIDTNVKLALAPLQTTLEVLKTKQKTSSAAIQSIGTLAEHKIQTMELLKGHYDAMMTSIHDKINPIHTMVSALGNLSLVSFANMDNQFKNISEQLRRMELQPQAKIDPIQLATLKNDLKLQIEAVGGEVGNIANNITNLIDDQASGFTNVNTKIGELQSKLVSSEAKTQEALNKLANAHEAIEAMKQTCLAALVRPPVECVSKAEVNAQEIANALAPLLKGQEKHCPETEARWYHQPKYAPKMKKCKFKTVPGTGVREWGWKRCMNPVSLENLNY